MGDIRCQLTVRLPKVPWTSTTGFGFAALGVQGTFAPGGGGVAADAVAGKTRAAAQAATVNGARMPRRYAAVRDEASVQNHDIDRC